MKRSNFVRDKIKPTPHYKIHKALKEDIEEKAIEPQIVEIDGKLYEKIFHPAGTVADIDCYGIRPVKEK